MLILFFCLATETQRLPIEVVISHHAPQQTEPFEGSVMQRGIVGNIVQPSRHFSFFNRPKQTETKRVFLLFLLQDGMGSLRVTQEGVRLEGVSEFLLPLYVKEVESRRVRLRDRVSFGLALTPPFLPRSGGLKKPDRVLQAAPLWPRSGRQPLMAAFKS